MSLLKMNKKGSYELADLAGFILIFIITIVFGYIVIQFSPEKRIEILDAEHGNYLVRQDLIDYLDYTFNGKNIADLIILNGNDLDEATEKFFDGSILTYWITISKNGEILKEYSNSAIIPYTSRPDKLKYNYVKILKNLNNEEINVAFTRYYS